LLDGSDTAAPEDEDEDEDDSEMELDPRTNFLFVFKQDSKGRIHVVTEFGAIPLIELGLCDRKIRSGNGSKTNLFRR
jgi:hypothetical protein